MKKKLLVPLLLSPFLVFGGVDWLLGLAMGDDKPTIKVSQGEHNGAAVVFFGDSDTSSEALAAPHRSTLLKHGDLITVNYSSSGFSGDAVVNETYKSLTTHGYKRAVLVGVGMGGELATDLIDHDRVNGNHLQFSVVLADAPTGQDDLNQTWRKWVVKHWHAGWMSDLALVKPASWMLYNGASGKGGPGVNQQQLDASNNAAQSYPLSTWTDQNRYQFDHMGYRPDTYKGLPMVYLQSEHDGVVNKNAAPKWRQIFGGGQILKVDGSAHAGLVGWPKIWEDRLVQALNQVA